eukprot:10106368-Lingulodinium_polyedra.AAC.1
MQKYARLIQPVALHGSGGWSWTKSFHDRLRRWEGGEARRHRRPAQEALTVLGGISGGAAWRGPEAFCQVRPRHVAGP